VASADTVEDAIVIIRELLASAVTRA
jgi:hypothetical protein